MKQPKVYVKYSNKVLEVESIRFDTKVVEAYDEEASIYDYCDFDEVEFIYGTGFMDKNGKEIESGDILKTEFKDIFSIKFHNFYGFYAVDEDAEHLFPEEEAVIKLPNNEVVTGEVEEWTTYDNKDTVKVKLKNGKQYLGHSSDVVLYND